MLSMHFLKEMKVIHQATMADLQEKQAEFDRITDLANHIIDRAHPDAIPPINSMIKGLQAKWLEVSPVLVFVIDVCIVWYHTVEDILFHTKFWQSHLRRSDPCGSSIVRV